MQSQVYFFPFFHNSSLNLCTAWPVLEMNHVWELRNAAILHPTPCIAVVRKSLIKRWGKKCFSYCVQLLCIFLLMGQYVIYFHAS